MPPAADPDDINEQSQAKVIELARQQCLDDPDQAEGVVQIVDPGTDEVVNEYRVDCDTVRNEQD